MTKARAAPELDRHPQNLPVPLGGLIPVRLTRRRRVRSRHVDKGAVALGGGAICGALGLALLLASPPVAVSLVGDRLHVGAMELAATGPAGSAQTVRYQGDASYVLVERGDGSATAAAVWGSASTTSTGVCKLHREAARLIAECSFVLGAERLTSVDVLDPGHGPLWQRTYADGVRVSIAVSPNGSAVPVAFPIGH